MRASFCALGAWAVVLAAGPLAACAAPADDAGAQADAITAVNAASGKSAAIAAFQADARIAAELAGHRARAPEAVLLRANASYGRAIDEYLVVTHYLNMPPGMRDAAIPVTVAAQVTLTSGTSTVRRVEIRPAEELGRAAAQGEMSAETAKQAYAADPEVAARLAGKSATAPEAVLLAQGSTFGAQVGSYLVVSRFEAGLPVRDAKIEQNVAAFVSFGPTRDAHVTLATIELAEEPTEPRP